MKYSEKLRDPRWQRVRLEVMNRDDFRCQGCGSLAKTLNVHHLSYRANPWESPLDQLETLCEECHGERTEINKELQTISTWDIFQIKDELRELIRARKECVAS